MSRAAVPDRGRSARVAAGPPRTWLPEHRRRAAAAAVGWAVLTAGLEAHRPGGGDSLALLGALLAVLGAVAAGVRPPARTSLIPGMVLLALVLSPFVVALVSGVLLAVLTTVGLSVAAAAPVAAVPCAAVLAPVADACWRTQNRGGNADSRDWWR